MRNRAELARMRNRAELSRMRNRAKHAKESSETSKARRGVIGRRSGDEVTGLRGWGLELVRVIGDPLPKRSRGRSGDLRDG